MVRTAQSRYKRNFPIFVALLKCKREQRRKIIDTIDKDLLEAICDVAHNILVGNVNITAKRKRQLGRHKKFLRYLADKNTGTGAKKKEINQSGGFLLAALLPALLGPIISTVIDAVG